MDGTTEKTPQALESTRHGISCSSMTAIGPSSPLCKFLGLRTDADGRLFRTTDFPDYDCPTVVFALVLFSLLAYKTVYELDIALEGNRGSIPEKAS
jgi:hypothetical protein